MYDRKLVFWAACLGMLLFGITMTTLGTILPQVILRYEVNKTAAGSLFTLMSLGILLGSFLFGPVVDRFGYRIFLVVSSLLVLLGLNGIAYAPGFGLLRLAAFIFGFGGGVINGGANALVSDISEEGRSASLAYLGVFFGIGAFGVPFLLGALPDRLTYTTILTGVSVVVLIPLLFFLSIRFPAPKHTQGLPIRQVAVLLRERTLLLLGCILFFESGMEITVGGWTTSYFTESLALDPETAVFFLSLFWVGMMVARLMLGKVLAHRSPARVLLICLGLAFFGAVLIISGRSLWLAAPGIFLIGAGFAASFPVILGFVGDLYPNLSGTAFSIAFAIALTGGMILPYVTGVLGDAYGLRLSFMVILLSLLSMAAVLRIVLHRFARYHQEVVNY